MAVLTPQMTYKPVDENPVEKSRNPKDSTITFALCCSMFVVVITGWFITNCINLSRVNISYFKMQDQFLINITNFKNETIVTLPIIYQSIFGNIALIILFALPGSIIFLLLLKTLSYLSKFWSVIVLSFIAVLLVQKIFDFFRTIYAFDNLENSHDGVSKLIPIIVHIIIFGISLSLVVSIRNHNHIIEVFKEIDRVAFSCPSVFLLTHIHSILSFTIVAFSAVSFYNTDSIASRVISLLGGIYLHGVILIFYKRTYKCGPSLDCPQNKEELSECITIRINTLKSICIFSRKEGISILFAGTIILPLIRFLYDCCSKKNLSFLQAGFRENYGKEFLISNGLEYVLASHPAVVRKITKNIFNFEFKGRLISSMVHILLFVSFAIGCIISVVVPFAIFQNSFLDFKAFFQTMFIYYGLGLVLHNGLFNMILFQVFSYVDDCIIRKKLIETVKQEMAHNEGIESKRYAIDPTQESNTVMHSDV